MTDDFADVPTHLGADLSIDQRLALKAAAAQLQSDFGEMFGVETIERFLLSSYDRFATRASVLTSCLCSPNGSLVNGFGH